MDLNKIMEINRVIRVDENGNVTDAHGVHGPETVYIGTDADGNILDEHDAAMVADLEAAGWDVLNGWSGQYRYSGPVMHESGLAKYILANPGLYVRLAVDVLPSGCQSGPDRQPCEAAENGYYCEHVDESAETENVGWIVAFRDTTCQEG